MFQLLSFCCRDFLVKPSAAAARHSSQTAGPWDLIMREHFFSFSMTIYKDVLKTDLSCVCCVVQGYAKEVNTLLDEIIAISPQKSGSKGQMFKMWGKSTPDTRAKRIEPPDGMKIIPFGFDTSKNARTVNKKR